MLAANFEDNEKHLHSQRVLSMVAYIRHPLYCRLHCFRNNLRFGAFSTFALAYREMEQNSLGHVMVMC